MIASNCLAKTKCLPKTDFCLNTKNGKDGLLRYVRNTIDSGQNLSQRKFGFYWSKCCKVNSSIVNKRFRIYIKNIKDSNNKTTSVLLRIFHYPLNKKKKNNKLCLKMELKTPIQMSGYYSFKTSYIHNINKGPCGINKTELKGPSLIRIADKINKIFKVESSSLEDDSRLDMCNTNMVLKTIKLLQYGKTWYEREAGFILDEPEIYELCKIVRKSKLSILFEVIRQDIVEQISSEYNATKDKYEPEIKKLENLLKIENLTLNNTYQQVFKKAIHPTSKLTDCQKIEVYNILFSNWDRKKVLNNKIPEDGIKGISKDTLEKYKAIINFEKKCRFKVKSTKIYNSEVEQKKIN